jgi:hypothetical protein
MTLRVGWSFDAGSGSTATDVTGNGHTATVGGWAAGHNSNGAAIRGAAGSSSVAAASYVGTLFTVTACTIECWAQPVAFSGTPDIITFTNATDDRYVGAYWGDNAHIRLYLQDSAGYQESALIELTIGAWTHMAITLDSTSVKLYLNGILAATLTRTAGATMGALNDIALGGHGAKGGGVYSDYRLYDNALTQAQVLTDMYTPLNWTPSVSVPASTVEWAADEGTGTTVADSSGNGNTGTASSAGWVTGHGTHAKAASGSATAPGVALEKALIAHYSAVTMMTWVKGITYTGSGDLLEMKSDHSSTEYATIYRYPSADVLTAEVKDSAGTTTTTVAYPFVTTAVWTHIALVLDSTSVKLYINGELAIVKARTGSADLGDMALLYAGGTDTKFNQGAVNDTRVYPAALNDDTIRYLSNLAVTPSGSNYTASPADNEGLTDTASTTRSSARTAADAEGATDAATVQLSAVRAAADSAGGTDAVTVVVTASRTASDTLGMTDSVSAELTSGYAVTPSDAESLSDAVATAMGTGRTANDSEALSDDVAARLDTNRGPADSAGATDDATWSMGRERAADDTVGMTDHATATLTHAGQVTVSVWDGSAESVGTMTMWNGSAEVAVDISIQS